MHQMCAFVVMGMMAVTVIMVSWHVHSNKLNLKTSAKSSILEIT